MYRYREEKLKYVYVDCNSMHDAMADLEPWMWTDFVLLLDTLSERGLEIISPSILEKSFSSQKEKESFCIRMEMQGIFVAADQATLDLAQECNAACIAFLPENVIESTIENTIESEDTRSEKKWDTFGCDIIVQSFEEVDFSFLERIWMRKRGIPWTILQTERTVLREMTLEDLDDMYAMYEKPGMTDYTQGLFEDHDAEAEYVKAYIDNMYRFYGYGFWLVLDAKTGELIGRAGLENKDFVQNGETKTGLEIGYLIDRDCWGRGLATEVCRAIMEFAFEELSEETLHLFAQKQNERSIQVAKKLGFEKQGIAYVDGEELLHYTVLKRKFYT